MAAPPSAYKDRHFLAVIGDEVRKAFGIFYQHLGHRLTVLQDSCTGLLLAGIGVRPREISHYQSSQIEHWLMFFIACDPTS